MSSTTAHAAGLTRTPAAALARAISQGDVSSAEVVDAHLDQIDRLNPSLNAVVQVAAERARTEARAADAARARGVTLGPLHGVPFTVKDQFDTADLVSTAGTAGRRRFVPAADATAVARLRQAGAILLGKTNVPEFALAFETDNLIYGRTNNPYDLDRTPGGSSGGEAALIAAGGSPLGLGSDAAGSIRWPAHCCGIAGLAPTFGRVPTTGALPSAIGLLGSLWRVGPLARTVEDLALAYRVLAGPDGLDPTVVPMPTGDPAAIDLARVRVAYFTDNGIAPADSDCAGAVHAAVRALDGAVAACTEARPDAIERTTDLALRLFGCDGGAGVQALLRMCGTSDLSPHLLRFAHDLAPFATDAAGIAALAFELDLYRAAMFGIFCGFDAIVCPVNAGVALPHGASWDEIPAFSYTMAFNLTGWPAAVVPAGVTANGLPVGVQIVAAPWREDIVLALAARIEASLGAAPFPAIASAPGRA